MTNQGVIKKLKRIQELHLYSSTATLCQVLVYVLRSGDGGARLEVSVHTSSKWSLETVT